MKKIIQIKAQGKSMLPVIPPGALLFIEIGSFNEQQPRPGELIAFRRGEQLVCHRFYGTLRIGWRRYGIEKGDANQVAGLFRISSYRGRLQQLGEQPGRILYRRISRPARRTLFSGLIRELLGRTRAAMRDKSGGCR